VERPVISVGVAGLGYWGPNLVRNFNASSRTELAWLCDRDPDRLERRIAPISGEEQGLRIVRVLAAAQESLSRGSERVRL
jgi:predicted dehydrogenase